jgi:hypothetical protein
MGILVRAALNGALREGVPIPRMGSRFRLLGGLDHFDTLSISLEGLKVHPFSEEPGDVDC